MPRKKKPERRGGGHLSEPINDMRRDNELSSSYYVYSGGSIIYLHLLSKRTISYYRDSALMTSCQNDKECTLRFDIQQYRELNNMSNLMPDIQECIESMNSEGLNNQMREIMEEVNVEIRRIK